MAGARRVLLVRRLREVAAGPPLGHQHGATALRHSARPRIRQDVAQQKDQAITKSNTGYRVNHQVREDLRLTKL